MHVLAPAEEGEVSPFWVVKNFHQVAMLKLLTTNKYCYFFLFRRDNAYSSLRLSRVHDPLEINGSLL